MASAVLSPAVRLEQLRALVANLPQSVIATAFAASALAYLLDPFVPWARSLPWIVVLNLVGVARLALYAWYRRRSPEDPANLPLLRAVTACAIASGLAWAAAPWVLYVPEQMHLQAAVLFACLAIATGGAVGTVVRRSTAFSIFVPPVLAPALFALYVPGRYYAILGVMALVYGAVVARILLVLHDQILHQIVLRFEKLELLEGLRRHAQEAEAANAAKSEFLASASHDLRQPMHAIALHVKTLSGQAMSPEAHQLVHRLGVSVEAMEGLFDALLDVSRLDSGAVTPKRHGFALDVLLRRLGAEFEPLAHEKGIALNVRPTPLWVTSDHVLLNQLLRNVVANAVRYTEKGGVLLGARRRGSNVSIEVWDSGLGIPEHEQRAVFREFHQLHNPERNRRRGLGLGLAIVDRIAKLLQHPIELRSRHGRGTMLRVEVPRAEPERAEPSLLSPSADGLRTGSPLVVVVEDDIDVLDATVMLLRHWGCEVVAGTTSDAAAAQLAHWVQVPDLLVCDYRLAEPRTGVEVVQWLRRALRADVGAILVTADTSRKPVEEALAAGIEILRKPLSPNRLKEVVFAALSRASSRQRATG
jgi:signal transduction histidine kinase